ncbi:MAG: hypothetical protein JWP65_2109 [Ramlibacter sp.]|jgi:hypothetical protein|uniref:sensor histidine kinase n=1 Tax=Ramlibacter sp. TaxID=1917967 RepID=UPI0026316932|nr:histidine kinase [Ramlibacter sp.]MDB5751688.1 hypothetical protein [Ramlibacter sp.]
MRPQSAPALFAAQPGELVRHVQEWSTAHPGALTMASLLAIAAPLRFLIGALSVMQQPATEDVLQLAGWWLLYAAVFWLALLLAGEAGERVSARAGRLARTLLWPALACGCAAAANLGAAGRARILIEQGVVQGALPMHLYGFALSFALALIYFAHLWRSRSHEDAAARLVAAQRAQREARRRRVQMDLQAVQARIDPALLFGMLDAVRLAYANDPPRAERLLDELIAFLRASFPHLRSVSSSVPREAERARAYAQMLSLAAAGGWSMTLDICEAARHARFPPGALLPLVDDALRTRGGQCKLTASCTAGTCRVVLDLPARPSDSSVQRVQALLQEIDGAPARVIVAAQGRRATVTLQVPHETA